MLLLVRCPSSISIHALREEGDRHEPTDVAGTANFNPRPPRGGRLEFVAIIIIFVFISIHALREEGDLTTTTTCREWCYFNPRPPRGGRLNLRYALNEMLKISIHALREEGDNYYNAALDKILEFQSTPSARRATFVVEDVKSKATNFNPRPPRGGRPFCLTQVYNNNQFQSTPSARRATMGQPKPFACMSLFQSTPSARRATAKAAKKSTTFVPLYTLVHNLKRNFTKAPAK